MNLFLGFLGVLGDLASLYTVCITEDAGGEDGITRIANGLEE
jgi:hypothetical protein